MILVTVGTHFQGFDRLVKAADELAAEMDEKVIIQRGSSSYIPRHAEHFQWSSSKQMEQLTREARIVIAHAAAGAAILALCNKKPLILVPRLHRFGENFDDHQRQLAKALSDQRRAIVVYEPSMSNLKSALVVAEQKVSIDERSEQLVIALKQRIDAWAKQETQSIRIEDQKLS